MQTPVQIVFIGVPRTDALEALIRVKTNKLARAFPRIARCHVVVEQADPSLDQVRTCHACVTLHVSGGEIAVDQARHQDPHVAVREAFDAAQHKLAGHARTKRSDSRHPKVEA